VTSFTASALLASSSHATIVSRVLAFKHYIYRCRGIGPSPLLIPFPFPFPAFPYLVPTDTAAVEITHGYIIKPYGKAGNGSGNETEWEN